MRNLNKFQSTAVFFLRHHIENHWHCLDQLDFESQKLFQFLTPVHPIKDNNNFDAFPSTRALDQVHILLFMRAIKRSVKKRRNYCTNINYHLFGILYTAMKQLNFMLLVLLLLSCDLWWILNGKFMTWNCFPG